MALSATMMGSAAYKRMCLENPSEFVPTSVFFTRDKDRESDRASSFWVKAALVYESITGQHVNEKTKPVAHWLLLSLAKKCCSLIHRPQEGSAAPVTSAPQSGSEGNGGSAAQKPQEGTQGKKTTQLPDEGSDENKQVIDGIFLVVGFLWRLKKAMGEGGKSNSRDVVDENFKSTHMQDIVTDVIKLENQIPLKHLLDVVDRVEEAVKDIANDIEKVIGKDMDKVIAKDIAEKLKGAQEFKGFLGDLEKYAEEFKRLHGDLAKYAEKYKLEFNRSNFHKMVDCFCWYYSPFFNTNSPTPFFDTKDAEKKNNPKIEDELTLLDYLHASLVPTLTGGAEAGGDAGGKTFLMPTARELRRSGVRFDAGKDGRAVVRFNEPSSSLRLPALVYDFKLATVARNLLAREYEEQSKPVTRYFQMMNELVVEVADVRILRRAGAVRGGSRGAHEVHELIKKIDGHATYPSVYMAMDLQIGKVRRFHDMRMKNFLVRYRPGVIWASSVAAVSVVAIIAARKKRAA